MTPRWQPAALLAIGLCASSVAARAEPGDATRLEYARDDGAQHCPDRTALREAVSKRLGYDPFFPAARQAIVVEITSVDDGLRAQLRLLDEDGIIRGSRELHERREQCEELVASLALAISIALDPAAALDVPERAGATAPAAEGGATADTTQTAPASEPPVEAKPPEPAHVATTARPGSTSRAAQPSTHFVGRAQGFSALGTAPALAFGFRLGAGFQRDWFALSGEFADQLPTSTEVEGGVASVSLLSFALVPCYSRSWARGCVLASVGSLTTEGKRVPEPYRQSTVQVSVGARLAFAPALSKNLRLLIDLDVLKPLVPVTLRLQDRDVWSSPWLTAAAGLGVEVQFP